MPKTGHDGHNESLSSEAEAETASGVLLLGSGGDRERHPKSRPPPGNADVRDRPAVGFDDLFDDRQAEAGPLRFSSHKRCKDLYPLGNPRAGVMDLQTDL